MSEVRATSGSAGTRALLELSNSVASSWYAPSFIHIYLYSKIKTFNNEWFTISESSSRGTIFKIYNRSPKVSQLGLA